MPFLLFLSLVLGIMAPLYRRGFLFLPDMVWNRQLQWPSTLSPDAPIAVGLKVLNFVVPGDILQKFVLSVILFLTGYGMYLLARRFFPPPNGRFWATVSGIFYLLNPYVFERFLSGQWLVLGGFALFPFVVKSLLDFLDEPRGKRWIIFCLLFSVYPVVSLHWGYIAALFLGTILLVYFFCCHSGLDQESMFMDSNTAPNLDPGLSSFAKSYGRAQRGNDSRGTYSLLIRRLVSLLAIFIAINAFWLFSGTHGVVSRITLDDFHAFETLVDPSLGPFLTVLSLYGFWQDIFLLPRDLFTFWWAGTILVIVCSVVGAITALRSVRLKTLSVIHQVYKVHKVYKAETQTTFLLATILFFIPALVVSVGYASPLTRPVVDVLFHYLPGFGGLRETAKVIGFLAFAYAIFFPIGVHALFQKFTPRKILQILTTAGVSAIALPPKADPPWAETKKEYIFIFVAAMVPFFIAGNMLWGFSGQIVPADYPSSWYQVNELIHAESAHPRILFLPWRGYLATSFSGGIKISNPAKEFFDAEVIAGNDPDNVFLKDASQSAWDEKIFNWLNVISSVDDDREFLHSQHIDYIVLAKESDWDRYDFFKKANSLKQIFDDPHITLYRVSPEQHGRLAIR